MMEWERGANGIKERKKGGEGWKYKINDSPLNLNIFFH
jgi:hypothetical protein